MGEMLIATASVDAGEVGGRGGVASLYADAGGWVWRFGALAVAVRHGTQTVESALRQFVAALPPGHVATLVGVRGPGGRWTIEEDDWTRDREVTRRVVVGCG